jgi:hypothetical protein
MLRTWADRTEATIGRWEDASRDQRSEVGLAIIRDAVARDTGARAQTLARNRNFAASPSRICRDAKREKLLNSEALRMRENFPDNLPK